MYLKDSLLPGMLITLVSRNEPVNILECESPKKLTAIYQIIEPRVESDLLNTPSSSDQAYQV